MDIRKAALVAFIAAVLSLVIPLWNATQQMRAITYSHPGWTLWVIPVAVLVTLFSALMPAFYFALYRTPRLRTAPVAFFQNSRDESDAELSVSTLLARVTDVVVKVWVVWLAINLLRVIMMPVIYVQLRDYALRAGGNPPELSAMIFDAIRMLTVQSCLFIAPFVVYRSRHASKRHEHEQAQEG